MKQKKQFRLYDIYRCVATGKQSQIKGIYQYTISMIHSNDEHEFEVFVQFASGIVYHEYLVNEEYLKDFVKRVNKHLGNCRKPGKKKKEVQDVGKI